jgi:hypothetical protein
MDEKVSIFRSFTDDNSIEEKEIIKFIEWGKGDLQQAINYYYKHLEKGKIKRTASLNKKEVAQQASSQV